MSVVVGILPAQVIEMTLGQILGENPIILEVSDFPAVLRGPKSLLVRADANDDQCARRVPSFLGDDVNDAVYGAGTPDCAPWPPEHFNAIDIFQGYILCRSE